MGQGLAIVGMACRYPEASSPVELWENVLAQRRSFRRIPAERLRLEDYFSGDQGAADCTYSTNGAFIEGYEFDRVRFRVTGRAYRSTDPAHWLALEVAADALSDAGFIEGHGLARESAGVFIGNTLTGDFSRANVMRLRWPYVRRVLDKALAEEAWPYEQRQSFFRRLERLYKNPFPNVCEETLAGGLANTIAGRISNHFDLKGGCYVVDGACASSLLAVINACSGLEAGDIDVALAGGVDLSIDPFELVGFAKAGALANRHMRIYDARSAGFWPGEGCGIVVLMRYEDAIASGRSIYAVIRGWGISSDGSGGITRPEVEGQLLALRRAYRRAGYGIETVSYFEGHGTGTAVGDLTELQALSRARREASPAIAPAAIGSVKANIGHTKAAAGIAGLIKATMSLKSQTLPPTTGCEIPHAELKNGSPALRVLNHCEGWPEEQPLRAGVSAMGFGGINTHLTLEAATGEPRHLPGTKEQALASSAQDAELFLLAAPSTASLRIMIDRLLGFAANLSLSELIDLAAQLEKRLAPGEARAAIVASTPAELAERLETLRVWLQAGTLTESRIEADLFLCTRAGRPRIGLLFPGQGTPLNFDGGAWSRRFDCVRELYAGVPTAVSDESTTAVAQPAIVRASVAALRVLEKLNIRASVAIGHSLGELTAIHWADALDEGALLRIASVRGRTMAEVRHHTGAMASIEAGEEEVKELLRGQEEVVIAGVNSQRQTVISGESNALAFVIAGARAKGFKCLSLSVTHAFHSPLLAQAAPKLAAHLKSESIRPLQRPVISTVTGEKLASETDLIKLLYRQVTSPVRFMEAVSVADKEEIDLWIEAGPGEILRGLFDDLRSTPVISLNAGGPSLKGLLRAAGACFALGAEFEHRELFTGRFTRPFDLDWRPRFLTNPCELAPLLDDAVRSEEMSKESLAGFEDEPAEGLAAETPLISSKLETVRQLVAERAELPLQVVKDDSRLLDDLHLNSITVGELVADAARALNLQPPVAPNDYATATIAELAQAFDEIASNDQAAGAGNRSEAPAGVDTWVRAFVSELVERPLRHHQPTARKGVWHVIAQPDHPLKNGLKQAFAQLETGQGVVVALPPEPDENHVGILLEGARAILAGQEDSCFVLVQHGGGAAAFARTLHQEAKQLTTCVVDIPFNHPRAVELVESEVLSASGYTEAHYDERGRRREPTLRPLAMKRKSEALPLTADDVLVVTGGARGITAECVIALGRETSARFALFGRARVEANDEIATNLERMRAAGIVFRYFSVDVTDEQAVWDSVRQVEAELGPVTAIIHGAARNVPQLISKLDEEEFLKTLAPKVAGARHLLKAIDPERLKLFVSFSSIIARAGLRGEAAYGLSNEWLTRLTERWQAEHPRCLCLSIEWSVWSGVGMGARIGSVDALMKQGIVPIPPDEGVAIMRQLLGQPLPSTAVIVTGRFTEMPTLKVERARELPFLRFLEMPLLYYPGVELIVDVELSPDTDPYLNDHVFQGKRLLPAVMGMEAMAQVALALIGADEPPSFEHVKFNRPIVVTETGLNIRIAALVRDESCVDVVMRSAETEYQFDHFSATCRFDSPPRIENHSIHPEQVDGSEQCVAINPLHDLYGRILFHRGRFKRLGRYRRLKTTACLAEIKPDGTTSWFGQYLPARLVLGDPGAHDAAIHAIQACIPQSTILPTGINRVIFNQEKRAAIQLVRANEVLRVGETFTYDVELLSADGKVLEYWQGLRLQVVKGAAFHGPWPDSLLSNYIERRILELIPEAEFALTIERDGCVERCVRSERAVQRALGERLTVLRRSDGKPEAVDGRCVSASHAGELTLAVAARTPVSCDVEPVVERAASVWRDLLGQAYMGLAELISKECEEELDVAATRVWNAGECLKKVGLAAKAPLALTRSYSDGWLLFSSGEFTITSFVVPMLNPEEKLAMAVLVRSYDTSL